MDLATPRQYVLISGSPAGIDVRPPEISPRPSKIPTSFSAQHKGQRPLLMSVERCRDESWLGRLIKDLFTLELHQDVDEGILCLEVRVAENFDVESYPSILVARRQTIEG